MLIREEQGEGTRPRRRDTAAEHYLDDGIGSRPSKLREPVRPGMQSASVNAITSPPARRTP